MAIPQVRWEGVVNAADYLLQDSELLRSGGSVVRAAVLRDSAVSVGVAFHAPEMLLGVCRSRGWPVLRRSSGGTALLHRPGDLLWSVLLPRAHPYVGRDFTRAYDRLGAPARFSLAAAGVAASWDPPLDLSPIFCLFGPRGSVLTAGGRAIGGAAQHLTSDRLLHHGVVQAGVDRGALAELFDLPEPLLLERVSGVHEFAPQADMRSIGRGLLSVWRSELSADGDAPSRKASA